MSGMTRRFFQVAVIVGGLYALSLSSPTPARAIPPCANSGCAGPEECNFHGATYCAHYVDGDDPVCRVMYC